MGQIDGILDDVDLFLERRRDIDRGVGDDQRFAVARHVHHEAVTDAPCGAQSGVAADDGAHQFVGMQAALHQRFGAAFAHQFDRPRGRGVAVGRIDDLGVTQIDAEFLCGGLDFLLRADQDGHDQSHFRRIHGA